MGYGAPTPTHRWPPPRLLKRGGGAYMHDLLSHGKGKHAWHLEPVGERDLLGWDLLRECLWMCQ